MTFGYVHPPLDNVAFNYYVDIPKGPYAAIEATETVEQAIEVYLQAFYQKFHSTEGRRHRKRSLHMFLQYLTEQGHSLKVKDITLAHGQGFLDSLTNHFNDMPLTATQKTKYRNALRSFSRFLHNLGLVDENIFLMVKKP